MNILIFFLNYSLSFEFELKAITLNIFIILDFKRFKKIILIYKKTIFLK